jgi:hypothetical protein
MDEDNDVRLVKEYCATVGDGVGDVVWAEGSFSTQTLRPVQADSLITAMSESDGYPTVIYQNNINGKLLRFHQSAELKADKNATGWQEKRVELVA